MANDLKGASPPPLAEASSSHSPLRASPRADDAAPPAPQGAGKAELEPGRDPDADLPVVARLIVEIRSDGSRTVARGAIEETTSGQRVAIEARGDSPLALALQLARSLGSLPRLSARAAVRGLLGRRKDK